MKAFLKLGLLSGFLDVKEQLPQIHIPLDCYPTTETGHIYSPEVIEYIKEDGHKRMVFEFLEDETLAGEIILHYRFKEIQ